jgi:2'-5' RNA ligase
VRRIRQRHGYDFYGALPVEITVAGSSGLGSPAPDQDARDVFSALDQVAEDTPAITARFGPVLRFPDTDIFVLTMEDPDPFVDLHERIGRSGVRFLPSPFPFTPHCTLRGQVVGAASSQETEDLTGISNNKEFRCEILSTYVVEGFPLLKLRHRSYLASTVEQPGQSK